MCSKQGEPPCKGPNTDRHAWVLEDSQGPVWLSRDQRPDHGKPQRTEVLLCAHRGALCTAEESKAYLFKDPLAVVWIAAIERPRKPS